MNGWLLPAGYLLTLVTATLLGAWSGRRLSQRRRAVAEAASAAAQETARRISAEIRRFPELPDAFAAAVGCLGEQLACSLAYVQLVRREEHVPIVWRPAPGSTTRTDVVPGAFLPLPDELFDLVSADRSLVADDARAHPGFQSPDLAAAVAGLDMVSLLVSPIASPAGVIGVVVLSRAVRRPFDHHEIGVVESVAWSLGRAVQSRVLQRQQDAVVERLELLDRSKSDFVASVSHELRTPLTSITGYVEMLLDGDGGPVSNGQREMLDIIGRNTGRLQTLIEDLLTIGKIESGALTRDVGEIEVGNLLRSIEAAMAPAVAAAGLRLLVPADDDLVVTGDRDQVEQVLLNLLGNAIKFTPPGGTVTVRTGHPASDWVELSVADTGVGVPQEDQDHVFTKFFRGSNATERAAQGAGLGLSIVENIVSAHGGTVTLSSADGAGTVITVRLPGRSRVPVAIG